MGRYLDILRRVEAEPAHDKNDKSPIAQAEVGTFGRFSRTCEELERRCPELVEPDRWEQAVDDARSFLSVWAERADALGWTARELFGLFPVPPHPSPSFQRLSRYDATGLIWHLRGRPVVALTAADAAIQGSNSVVMYRKHNKPALGPIGDSLDEREQPNGRLPVDACR